ncbi:MAG: M50 family metallopeptidase [bacterium]
MDLNFLDAVKTIIVLVFTIAIVVVIHELGHFLAAKLCKVRVDEFAFGMGKKLWGKKYKGTLFRINLLPIGGYVKIYGQETSVENDPNSYSEKPALQRLFILFAGVFMNVILAIVIFYIYLISSGFVVYFPKIADYSFPGIKEELISKPWVKLVADGSSAKEANLPINSLIWSIDGKDVNSASNFSDIVKASYGKTIDIKLQIVRDQSFQNIKVNVNKLNDLGVPVIGVSFSPIEYYKLDYTNQKVFSGIVETYNVFGYSMSAYGELINQSFQTKSLEPVSSGTGTIVQVGQVTYRFVAADNFIDILFLIGSISLSLAFFNILPIPALDGGHVMFVIIEKIRGKPLSEKLMGIINMTGFVLLMILFVVLLFKDVLQINFIQGIIKAVTGLFGNK